MELLACLFVVVGCFEYATAECAQDSFHNWTAIDFGDRPAHCADAGCLPLEWEEEHIVRRQMECVC